MALVNGDVILVESDSNTYVGTTSTSVEIAADMIDKTTKDSNAYKEFTRGERSLTISVEGLHNVDETTQSGEVAFDDLVAGTEVTYKWGQFATAGDRYITGSALVESVSIDAPKNEMTTYSVTLRSTGSFAWAEVSS